MVMSFRHEVNADGISLYLENNNKSLFSKTNESLKLSEWVSGGDSNILRGLAALNEEIQNCENLNSYNLVVSHKKIAELDESAANSLGLPISLPYQLRISGHGNWFNDTYDLGQELLDFGTVINVDKRIGSIVYIGKKIYRLPEPLYSLCEEVYNFPRTRDGKIEAQARIAEILNEGHNKKNIIEADDQITSIRIRHVSGFSANISGSLEDPILKPVLFAKHILDNADIDDELISEMQQILSPSQSESFNQEFISSKEAKATYVLGSGEYIYIDPSARPAFQSFRKLCDAPSNVRKAFINSPNAVLSEFVDECEEEEFLINSSFIQTSEFSDRVIGIVHWQPPELPWLARESNDWGTNVIIFEQPGISNNIIIDREELPEAITVVKEALASGRKEVEFNGMKFPISNELLSSMESYIPATPDKQDNHLCPDNEDEEIDSGPFVVDVLEGFESINYVRRKIPPDAHLQFKTPRVLVPSTVLKKHQNNALKWLVDAYNNGMPGVLMADDMGLGKTLQSIVFLALYNEQITNKRSKPNLIIAPSGLLENWNKEFSIHLTDLGIGNTAKVYGKNLKEFKNKIKGKDTDTGVPLLNIPLIKQYDLVMTTYETLRDYHISFSQISFAIVIFDEIQKTKNPRSLISKSAKSINGDFQIGLSGTPVENSLSDLWQILDILSPGLIKYSLKDFMKEYSGSVEDLETLDKLKKLQNELLTDEKGRIPPVLRRLKEEVFRNGDLPKKYIVPAESTCKIMPPEQAEIYKQQLDNVHKGNLSMLSALHNFKRISLSPRPFAEWLTDIDKYIFSSGRLEIFFEILDEIKRRDEKALIFVDSRDLQPILAQVLKERYKLQTLPLIINGQVAGTVRQSYVDKFQDEEKGFNIMLLSPRAGGIGLTLTAANNVLHLERWWNPAVEDQCNDRVYRIGQKKDVKIYTPVCKHPINELASFDMVLNSILTRKRNLSSSLFIPTELNPEEFSGMFSDNFSSKRSSAFRPINIEESYLFEKGEDFENYIADNLHHAGFKVKKTPRSWDKGCDLLANFQEFSILCQIKQVQSDKVLLNGISEIIDAGNFYSSHMPTHLALLTNARAISGNEKKKANDNNVIVLNADHIDKYGQSLLNIIRH